MVFFDYQMFYLTFKIKPLSISFFVEKKNYSKIIVTAEIFSTYIQLMEYNYITGF